MRNATRNAFNLSAYFTLNEFESPDTGEVMVDSRLIKKLEALRYLVGKPITILSGYRTPEHNAAVGGEPGSFHTKGMAADVTWQGFDVEDAAQKAIQVGFDGIGKYPTKNFIHVDVRGTKARWVLTANGYEGWS